jgi:aryl-alcohol dehydrogenase-like predicted oxidoreductase
VQVEHSVLNPSVVSAIVGSRRADQIIVGRSVLAKGLLTARREADAAMVAALASTLDSLQDRASAWGFSLPELAIRFALDTSGIDVIVVGISTREEIETALNATKRQPLTAAQMKELASFDRSAEPLVHPERWPRTAGGRV